MEFVMSNEAIASKGRDQMKAAEMKPWIFHTEWATLMATIIGCFLFVHHEAVHVTERLDYHIAESSKRHDELVISINRRIDESNNATNRRCDELHKEFYELLKEMRK